MSDIDVFHHSAMATQFQVRIAGVEKSYAAQAAQAAFALTDDLESRLSRFRENSDIARIAQLVPGEELRVSEPAFACLEIAEKMEAATRGAFSVTAAALRDQPQRPRWSLRREAFSIRSGGGRLEFDLGAIGKGFALDRMAEVLREWDCLSFLLVAGGSSVLAGAGPVGTPGWSCGLGENDSAQRYWLTHCSLSGSGLAVKGAHILDPRTAQPAHRQHRAWALTGSGAESDALSTACMVWDEAELLEIIGERSDWLVFLDQGGGWRGRRALPPAA